jgi:hypothetical protein
MKNNVTIAGIATIITVGIGLVLLFGPTAGLSAKDMPKVNCVQCHACETPTAENPCLTNCPRISQVNVAGRHDLSEAPKVLILNKLVNQYGAVHFNHKLHAEMAGMNQGCPTCHHYSPEGHISPCSDCHGREGQTADLGQPGLKGAFHRQCISCHREWSHDTDCRICHMPLEGKSTSSGTSVDSTDIIGISHVRLVEPDKKVYYTSYQEKPVVTFFHKDHTELFNLKCVDCHTKENCSGCHDIEKPVRAAKTEAEVHAICSGCHVSNRCETCHDSKEKPAFAHGSTGWPLNQYHVKVECRGCHPTGKRITRLRADCVACHGSWNQQNFRHAVTGLQLDETHAEADCSDCHRDKRYDAKPDCSTCHDDNRSPEQNPPGLYVKTRG